MAGASGCPCSACPAGSSLKAVVVASCWGVRLDWGGLSGLKHPRRIVPVFNARKAGYQLRLPRGIVVLHVQATSASNKQETHLNLPFAPLYGMKATF